MPVHADPAAAKAPLTGRQRLLVGVAMLTMTTDSVDITVPGFVYPQLVREWGASIGAITATVTVGVLAMALGGAVAGPLADRYGRRLVSIVGVPLFGLTTIGMGLSGSIEVFAGLRLLACFGLGAVMPVMMAAVADGVPPTRRGPMVTLTFAGTGIGTTVSGFLASTLIPAAGWQTLLVVCGTLPLLLLPGIVLLVREPARGVIADEPSGPLGQVLARSMLPTTLLVWLCFLIGVGSVFLILNYLPLIVERAGFTIGQAGILVALFGWGGLLGQLGVVWALHRLDRFRLLAGLLVAAAAAVWLIAALQPQFGLLAGLSFVLGLVLPGANGALYAVAALAYPPRTRATGMGWGSGFGRVGTLVSGLAGGLMVGAGWGLGGIFGVLGVPLLVGAGAALGLRARTRRLGDVATAVDDGRGAGAQPVAGTAR